MNTNKEPSAAEQVAEIAESQIEDIRLLLCPTEEDVEAKRTDEGVSLLIDNGCAAEVEVGNDDLTFYLDDDGKIDSDTLVSEYWNELEEQARERYYEHGLSFDYYEHENAQAHWTYLISTGGPGTEIRFFAYHNLELYRAEFWFLPWFDGACVNVTNDPTVQALWEDFKESGTAAHVRDKND